VIPAQKWTIFYNKVLSRFAVGHQLRLRVEFDVQSEDGISTQKLDNDTGVATLDFEKG
jgi:hypothetical protein